MDDDRIMDASFTPDTTAAPPWVVSALFAPPLRLGWHFRSPRPKVLSSDRDNAPVSQYDVQLARGRRMFNIGIASVVVAALVLLLLINNSGGASAYLLIVIYAVGLYRLGRWAFEIPVQEGRAIAGVFTVAFLFATFLLQSFPLLQIPLALLLVFGLPAAVVIHAMNLTSTAEALRTEHDTQIAAWRRRIEAFERDEELRWQKEQASQWLSVQLSPSARVLTIFGGSAPGWGSMLTTFGASALAVGGRLTILDLSERGTTNELCAMAHQRGSHVRVSEMPGGLNHAGLLGGLAPLALANLLADVLHARDDRPAREEKARDRKILSTVCTNLGSPVTLPRVQAGLRALRLLRATGDVQPLSDDEFDRISAAFSDDERTELSKRVIDIDHQLDSFLGLASQLGENESVTPDAYDLHVLTIARENESLDNEYFVDLLFQLLLRQFRHGEPERDSPDIFLIAGADRLSSRDLETMARFAERESVKLVYLFERLTKDGQSILGVGGYAAFMKLGNHEDAKIACDYIGKDFKFVVNQITKGTSTGTTETTGTSYTEGDTTGTSTPPGLMGPFRRTRSRSRSRSWTDSRSTAESVTDSESTAEGRVEELLVQPHEIQQLSDTSLFYVEMAGHRRVAFVDCSPEIVGQPGVAQQPLELE